VPGSLKARSVIARNQRLSAATYLKVPTVFGFNGVYKTFAVDAEIITSDLEPGPACAAVTKAWEDDQGHIGFTDEVEGSEGARMRSDIRHQVRNALRQGKCVTSTGSWLLGKLAMSLNPDAAGSRERRLLRSLITDTHHPERAELAKYLEAMIGSDLTEAQMILSVKGAASPQLRLIIEAVVAYERLAAMLDSAFRTLCSVSYSLGARPMIARDVERHQLIVGAGLELPGLYQEASERMAAIDAEAGLEERLGEFAVHQKPPQLVELILAHHERVQLAKPPGGKRPWFEHLRNGWVVRPQYGAPTLASSEFVHPVRVNALRSFLADTMT
jgi:hypothetical protein